MNNFLKLLLKKNNLIIISIFLLAAFVRFYNFSNRVTFWSEQARSLIVSANYIKKPSLLGQEYFRQDSNSHTIYSGALFNYSLVPLLYLGNWNPVFITVYFAFLNLVTGLVIYLLVKKMFGQKLANVSTILFLFNDFMIYHSLFIWNYNYLPLIGILMFYFSWMNFKFRKLKYLFLLGLVGGIGISIQILFSPIAVLVLIINLWHSKTKMVDSILFILGIILGNLPMVIFDLRHSFYQTQTLWQYLLDTLHGKSDAGLAYYYFLPFWPILALIGGYVVLRIFKINRFVGFGVLMLYLYLNLISSNINWNKPTGMPTGLTVQDVDLASQKMAKDVDGGFNVAETLDFDSRAYVLRYFVQYKYGKAPLGVADYQNLKLLYVLASKDYNLAKSDTWEIKAGMPYRISKMSDIDGSYALFKLQK